MSKLCAVTLMDGQIVDTKVEDGVTLIIIDSDEFDKEGGNPYTQIKGDYPHASISREVEEAENSIMRKELIKILTAEEIPVETLAGMTVKELKSMYFQTFKDYFRIGENNARN